MLKERLRNLIRNRDGGGAMSLIPWRNKRRHEESLPVVVSEHERVRKQMLRFMERFFRDPWSIEPLDLFGELLPEMDISETTREVVVKMDLPGVEPEDLEISLSGDVLTITGRRSEEVEDRDANVFLCERHYGAFQRVVQLPCPVEPEKVDARFRRGVLTVRLKKAHVKEPRRIRVLADR